MRFLSTTNFTLMMAGTPGTVTPLFVPEEGAMTTQVRSFVGLPCEISRCNKSLDIYNLPKTFIQDLRTLGTSLAIRESSLATSGTSLAIRDTSLALRDPQPVPADSTTTTTIITPIINLTMSCWGPFFTPVDGTTYHCSTTIPPPVSNFNSISNGATIMSNGSPAATIISPESTFSVMPPPSITSARPFVTMSNASTTIITPASDLSNMTSSMATVNSTTFSNTTTSISQFPTITLTSLATVDPPSVTNTIPSGTSIDSSAMSSASNTDAPQSAGQDFKIGYNKFGTALIAVLVVNVVLAAIL